jgi:hypothetical protein
MVDVMFLAILVNVYVCVGVVGVGASVGERMGGLGEVHRCGRGGVY